MINVDSHNSYDLNKNWFGVFVENDESDDESHDDLPIKDHILPIGLGGGAIAFLVLFSIVVYCFIRRKKKKRHKKANAGTKQILSWEI